MRKDLHRKIVEDGARGGHNAKVRRRRQEERRAIRAGEEAADELPKRGKTKRQSQYGYDSKDFGDKLNPLRRMLRAQVGRRWDDVYSEICQLYPGKNTMSRHVHEHLFDTVTRVEDIGFRDDGLPILKQYGYYSILNPRGLYVDANGVLRGVWELMPASSSKQDKNNPLVRARSEILQNREVSFVVDGESFFYKNGNYFKLLIRPVNRLKPPVLVSPLYGHAKAVKKVDGYVEYRFATALYCLASDGRRDMFFSDMQRVEQSDKPLLAPAFCFMRPSKVIARYGSYGVCVGKRQLASKAIRRLKSVLGLV